MMFQSLMSAVQDDGVNEKAMEQLVQVTVDELDQAVRAEHAQRLAEVEERLLRLLSPEAKEVFMDLQVLQEAERSEVLRSAWAHGARWGGALAGWLANGAVSAPFVPFDGQGS